MHEINRTDAREAIELARDRIVRLYKFVAALYDRRNPAVRQVGDHEWIVRFSDIPEHSSILLNRVPDILGDGQEDAADDSEEALLSCKRPPITPPPSEPETLRGWLGREWEDCRTENPAPLRSRNTDDSEGGAEAFTEDLGRVRALQAYSERWADWAANERVALKAGELFEKLYALHGKLQREGERYELTLADGLLVWYRSDGGVRHPLLLRPVRLEFDADAQTPEFQIIDAGAPTEFYSSLFRSMADVDGRSIGRLRAESEQLELHPLGLADTDGFLRSLVMALSPRGQYAGATSIGAERPDPVIGRAPCFLLRKRTTGVARAIDAIAENASLASGFAQALCNIVGRPVLESVEASPAQTSITAPGPLSPTDANEDLNVLFTKPANAEQLEIARRLELHDCVLVQGPPGTGKTHTIANLLGHLLARGKSVLVCSHTTKALKVLRDKVVPELQPLCVSVMDAPDDDQALKTSVEGIVARLSSADEGTLARDIARLEADRNSLISQSQEARLAILNARLEEQHPLVIGGESTGAIDAAKEVAAGVGTHDWIPGPVSQGKPLPLAYNELADLYATTGQVTPQDEQSLLHRLPETAQLPTPERFAALMEARAAFSELDETHRRDLWNADVGELEEVLDAAFDACRNALEWLSDKPAWTRAIVVDGAATDLEQRAWNALLEEIERTYTMYMEAKECMVLHAPRPSDNVPRERAPEIFGQIAEHVRAKGSPPSFLMLLTRREWKAALDGSSILDERKPRLLDHFEALATAARLTAQRDLLRRRWDAQVVVVGGPRWDDSQEQIEASCRRFADLIRSSIHWHRAVWLEAQHQLYNVGLKWDLIASEANARYAEHDAIERLRRIVEDVLPDVLASERARRGLAAINRELAGALSTLKREGEGSAASALRSAIESFDPGKYGSAFDELVRIRGVSERGRLRATLLGRLEAAAPGWAAAIRIRRAEHGEPHLPGDPVKAWWWRQFTQELDRREATSLPDLTNKLEHLRQALRRVTAELVDRKAWLAQLERTTLEQRQALMGFAQAKRRIGRGTGKKAATLIRMAREQMSKARSAVPVWIMPIVKAAEVFDPRETKFDVVIVDEASQSDVTGLVVVYLGRQTVVVGDDEQVSPAAVGEKISDSQHLIDEFLQGIPNADLFDGKQSLYDIASSSFGADICLLEHFRCVPDIIRFSNALSYGGKILPLREATANLPQPAVVAHRVVAAGTMDGKVNEVEARTVASLIAGAAEQPEYRDKTFGVISMVGDDQAYRIETILRTLLSPKEIESRRLLCGSAAQFQGDERNVMFLSMVQVGSGAPLPMLQERTAQQRFNVAASRAQDQMWIVYSLDPATELKTGDLRRRLIEHALDPSKLSSAEAMALDKAESPFEVEVIRRLSSGGYYVRSQYPVGAFRIDIVVQGRGKARLAVECDGERYHRIEDLQQDADRQAILERLGWTFCRIRGSSFYRNRDAAMEQVFLKLKTSGIEPLDGPTVIEADAGDLVGRVRTRAAEIFELIETPVAGHNRSRRWRD